jgi:hypothetical protein
MASQEPLDSPSDQEEDHEFVLRIRVTRNTTSYAKRMVVASLYVFLDPLYADRFTNSQVIKDESWSVPLQPIANSTLLPSDEYVQLHKKMIQSNAIAESNQTFILSVVCIQKLC